MSDVSVLESHEPTAPGPPSLSPRPPRLVATAESPTAPPSTPDDDLLRLVTTVPTPTTTMVEVGGEIDLFTAPRLAGVLTTPAPTTQTLVIDLTAVTFIGAVGLSALVQAHHHTRSAGQSLRLITGPWCVNRVLEITGLDHELACYPAPTPTPQPSPA